MALIDQLKKLASAENSPSVTISLNTHRTHPDSMKDELVLKNIVKEAENRLSEKYNTREISNLLKKLKNLHAKIDFRHNFESLHIFLSDDTEEMIKSTWPTNTEGVHISAKFKVRPLIKAFNRSENYLIMLLSRGGIQLYEAVDDTIVNEIKDDNFPFPEKWHYAENRVRASDPELVDNMVREFYNTVDKSLQAVSNDTGLNCVVICTPDNYSYLQQVADRPAIYLGYAPIDYNNAATHQISKQAWEIVKSLQKERRAAAIREMKKAVSDGNVLTDLQEIYEAAIDGRGDLLIVYHDYKQAVIMRDERRFDLTDDPAQADAIDDITSTIAWKVLSQKGSVFFTSQEEIKEFGKIVLKTRY